MADELEEIPCALVVMGVSGSGKSTIAQELAERLGWRYEDGDKFHPASNVAKMSAGQPLTDEDRRKPRSHRDLPHRRVEPEETL